MEVPKNAAQVEDEEKEIEQKMIKIISMMPKEVQNRFKVLKVLSDKRSRLADQFEEEIKSLDAQIAAKKKPLYEQRKKIIAGEVTDFSSFTTTFDNTHKKLVEECGKIVTKPPAEPQAQNEASSQPTDPNEIKPVDVEHLKTVKGIPDFWFKSIKNNQMISELVKEKDEEILKHVNNVEAERLENPKALLVRFFFSTNEFFTNDSLSLKIFYRGDQDDVEKIEGTVINWNEGKDPTKKKIKKKQKNKKTNETRTIVKTVDAESFFNCFASRQAPDENSNLESDEENTLQDQIDMAMNLAEDVEDVLIPDALEYYLALNDDLYDSEGEGDDDDEAGGSGGDSDDDDTNEGSKKKQTKTKGKGGEKKGGDAAQQQECKQQ